MAVAYAPPGSAPLSLTLALAHSLVLPLCRFYRPGQEPGLVVSRWLHFGRTSRSFSLVVRACLDWRDASGIGYRILPVTAQSRKKRTCGSPYKFPLAHDRKSCSSASFKGGRARVGKLVVGNGPSCTCRCLVAVIFACWAFTGKSFHVEGLMHSHVCKQSQTTPGRYLSTSLLQVMFLCICGACIAVLTVHRPQDPRAHRTSYRCIKVAQHLSDASMCIDIMDIHHVENNNMNLRKRVSSEGRASAACKQGRVRAPLTKKEVQTETGSAASGGAVAGHSRKKPPPVTGA